MKIKRFRLNIPSTEDVVIEKEVNKTLKERKVKVDDIVSFSDDIYSGRHPNPTLENSTTILWTSVCVWYKEK